MNSSCCAFPAPILDQVLPPILFLEFVLGMVGNSFGLWMICRQMKNWKPNSVYLFSLTVADFIVLFGVLLRADYYRRKKDWIFGDVPCRLLLYVLSACRSAGIISLTIIAFDRYCKIVFPFHRINNITVKQAALISSILWLSILVMYSYLLLKPHFFIINNSTQCESFNICFSSASWHDAFYILLSLSSLSIILYCTICIALYLNDNTIDKNGKVRRAVKFVLSIAIVFTMCYLPSNIVRISVWILTVQDKRECKYYEDTNTAFYVTVCFTYFYSMLNPIIYYFSSPSFNCIFQQLWNKFGFGKTVSDHGSSISKVIDN
ncbi:hydroxycarboxylic acid receptor 3-like [Bombina bombina]|uniref:hydroxycarboxylic acid receptor 3-like n=1 Tax=Bombina bombina TaxID=8345 RepID=UPI00235AFB46|nr:hydroxycarboxylic acid receptor 3-like [Bombina bombina]